MLVILQICRVFHHTERFNSLENYATGTKHTLALRIYIYSLCFLAGKQQQ